MFDKHTLTAIIVDDELSSVLNLQMLLGKYCHSITVIDTARSADSGSFLINTAKPDVVFLDVSMPVKNGFDLLNMLDYTPAVVFVTAHEQYAINAFKSNAMDFLLKPVDITELKKTEEKLLQIKKMFEAHDIREGYKTAVANLVNILSGGNSPKTITLPGSHSYRIVSVNDILYLQGENNYTSFYLKDGQKIIVSKTLKEYESLLQDAEFMRIHKSSMINMRHLKAMDKKENIMVVVMSDNKVLEVSRRRGPELLKSAKQYNL